MEISRERYYRIIDLKTAELFRASCRLGASLAGYPEAFVNAVNDFGRHLAGGVVEKNHLRIPVVQR